MQNRLLAAGDSCAQVVPQSFSGNEQGDRLSNVLPAKSIITAMIKQLELESTLFLKIIKKVLQLKI